MRKQKDEGRQVSSNCEVSLPEDVPRTFVNTIRQLAESEKWDLKSKKKNYEDLSIILKYMPHSNKAKYIFLQWNHMPRILQLFIHCPFSNLKALTLGGNNIESIQLISRVDFVQLQEVWLWNNKITKVRSLRKMRAPHLRVVDLSSNLLVQNDSWSEYGFKYLQNINLEKNRLGNINNMVKLQSQIGKLRVDIINNDLPSIIRCLPKQKEGKKIATYFYIRSFAILYR